MLHPDRESMLLAIEALGRDACNYSPTFWALRCGCKFGFEPSTPARLETNGCPELRVLYEVVREMSDEEWEAFR